MVTMTATVDGAASRAFNNALAMWRDSLGMASASVPRRAALKMCTSFGAATKEAAKEKGMTFEPSNEHPAWISYKDGRKLERPLRRYKVTLTDPGRGRTFERFVYADDAKNELRRLCGTNYFWLGAKKQPQKKGGVRGLAKRSWGWVKHNIYAGKNPDAPWQMRKNDHRNPKDATGDSCSTVTRTATASSGMARICNRLDYIGDALKLSVQEVIGKTTSGIIQMLARPRLRADGFTAREARAEAERIAHEFRARFPD